MDSRGNGLYEKIQKFQNDEYIGLWRHDGGTLDQVSDDAASHLDSYPFDLVYIEGGVNNITRKDRMTRKVSFPWEPPELLMEHLSAILERLEKKFKSEYPASKVIFCPLVGSELTRIVNEGETTERQQIAVNNAVFTFNEKVFKINARNELFSPSLHRTVHRSKNGVKKSHYSHLHDGIHLGEYLKDKWAEEFVKAAKHN